MNPRWLLMMKRWVQNPPSPARMKLIVGVIVLCFLIYGAEQMFGWPDWLTVNRMRP
jgi:hypothetical protein